MARSAHSMRPEIRFGLRRWAVAGDAGKIVSSRIEIENEAELLARIPALLRRRLSPLGRRALATAFAAGLDADCHVVFASRLGEIVRTLDILGDMGRGEAVSPTAFGLSVHNAIAGVASIALANRRAYTAVAAGPDSLFQGFVEAVAIANDEPAIPVLFVYGEDDPPAETGESFADCRAAAIAVRLDAGPDCQLIGPVPVDGAAPGSGDPSEVAGRFVDFLGGRSHDLVVDFRGARWRIKHGG